MTNEQKIKLKAIVKSWLGEDRPAEDIELVFKACCLEVLAAEEVARTHNMPFDLEEVLAEFEEVGVPDTALYVH